MNYIEINRDSWNQRTDFHVKSEFYDVEGFLKGNSSLNEIELELLGDIRGKSLLHLQCHFGQDTLSLARLGAIPTGVDLSDNAIAQANALAKAAGIAADFICCDLYELPQHLEKQFDIVFTSYGTIGWLPDLDKWAKVVAAALKPGGKFVFVEFHPVVWMFNDDFDSIAYNYFNTGPIVEEEAGTYADRDAPINQKNVTWNHGLGEVMTSLLSNNLAIKLFQEFNYSPYACFKHTVEFEPNKFRIKNLDDKIPMVYALVATKV
ncbi:class I SAM-dependent methyltransferase [Hymenobacter arizonensis]|uniref:Methyltransferase domain-containing protein n=1 Tax=Hymenobacter arizonensis TaxID=1227077 RepID=A0A1I5SL32_HYMAR|nr:class I SAM-dependent methyltransferase [Hymenobacter arizonensis]SFP71351.1 Methyltransferase domain-containing protein [Hymenobacter arizonensis]